MKHILIALSAGLTILMLTGCPGGGDSASTGDAGDSGGGNSHPVTTSIPQDSLSDLQDAQVIVKTAQQIAAACSSSCAASNMVEHDDFFDVAFDLIADNVRVFSFRAGWGACAIKLTGANGGVVHADTYNKWDPDQMAQDRNMHFTVGKSNQNSDYCVPNGSMWEKVDCTTQSDDKIMHLRRIDQAGSSEQIWISTFKGWKGTLMAKKSGIIHPMACQ